MEFRFVRGFFPKYLHCSTFSKDLLMTNILLPEIPLISDPLLLPPAAQEFVGHVAGMFL
jgi:hypothetical protein